MSTGQPNHRELFDLCQYNTDFYEADLKSGISSRQQGWFGAAWDMGMGVKGGSLSQVSGDQ